MVEREASAGFKSRDGCDCFSMLFVLILVFVSSSTSTVD